MADNGSSMYISGAPDDRWDNDDLHNLGTLKASDFEVVQMNPNYTQANVPQGAAPTISSFTASSTSISSGTQITLSWSVSGGGYIIVSPQIGAVRGTSRNADAHADNHIHALRHEPVRPLYGNGNGHRALGRLPLRYGQAAIVNRILTLSPLECASY